MNRINEIKKESIEEVLTKINNYVKKHDVINEYDIQDIGIECFLGANNKLNYLLTLGNKKIWIIQSADVLDLDEVGEVNSRLYQDDKIANKIDQLELEGEKQKLTNEENE